MTAAASSSEGDQPAPGANPPPPQFTAELRTAFRRLQPQGSLHWNFSDAFTRLEQRFSTNRLSAPGTLSTNPLNGTAATPAGPRHSLLHRLGDRYIAARLRPWIEELVTAAALEAVDRASAAQKEGMADGFDATVEAFRFLAARVQTLEDAATRRHDPIDGLDWLVPAPRLEQWAGPAARWLKGGPPVGEVLHGECGDGALTAALAAAGVPIRGAEPRGAVAWEAAERAVDVHVGSVVELLRSMAGGSLGGLVLSGVVDRLPVEELVALLAAATDRLAAGASVVIVSTRPDGAETGWNAVARDLVPGRPLHPETWELLLGRAGYVEVGRLEGPPEGGRGQEGDHSGTYAVRGRRPS